MALPEDFNKIYGSTATGGLTPISDVNYAKGWEFVGANPPTKNDFSYLQNLSDRKSQWLYSNKLQRTDPFGDIKADGASAIADALANLGFVSFPQYQNLGDGQHIIQHGYGVTNSSGIVDIVFPKAFTTTNNLNVIATATAATPSNYIITVGAPTLTGVRIYATGAIAGAIPVASFAIGFQWFATGR